MSRSLFRSLCLSAALLGCAWPDSARAAITFDFHFTNFELFTPANPPTYAVFPGVTTDVAYSSLRLTSATGRFEATDDGISGGSSASGFTDFNDFLSEFNGTWTLIFNEGQSEEAVFEGQFATNLVAADLPRPTITNPANAASVPVDQNVTFTTPAGFGSAGGLFVEQTPGGDIFQELNSATNFWDPSQDMLANRDYAMTVTVYRDASDVAPTIASEFTHISGDLLDLGDQLIGTTQIETGDIVAVTTVPEPASLTLAGFACLGILTRRRRQSR